MILMKFPQPQITLTCAITLVLATTCVPLQASTTTQPSPQPQPQEEPDFSGYGRPGRRAGGGSRSPCSSTNPPLTALIPVTNTGKTIAERPTLWFYVPYSPQQAPVGEFVLQEEGGNDVYRTLFALPETPGFVSLSPPPTVAPLEINKSYRWYFKLYCEPQRTSAPIFVEGWVQRVEATPQLANQLYLAAQEYSVYATYGIWYDAVASLAQLRLTNPLNDRLNEDWAKLLSSRGVNLETLNQESIVGSAIPHQR